ncbi:MULTISPECIES: hypothetical protein [unclassified Duganella]|uniref:hypothetical protein n=1 Tax=unclassified Duganella TaxID=2636909 RepID=UPI0011C12FDC|nr:MULTISPECIES: hypothetical protein [unclassified Duganella]
MARLDCAKATLLFLVLLLARLPIAKAVDNAVYAPTKLNICDPCPDLEIPVSRPRRGIVISTGALFSSNASWKIVDLDTHTLKHVSVLIDRISGNWGAPAVESQLLTNDEEYKILMKANEIWAAPHAIPSISVIHPVWGLSLFDENVERREGGAGLPDGEAKELVSIFDEIWQKKININLPLPARTWLRRIDYFQV